MKIRKVIAKTTVYLLLSAIAALQLVPLAFMVLNTLRTDIAIKKMPIGIPEKWKFSNYAETWTKGGYGQAYINSIIVSALCIAIVVTLTLFAAYAMTRLKLPGGNLFVGYFILALSFPAFLYIIPDYFLFNKIGLIDSLIGLVIIYSAGYIPLNLMLCRTYLVGIPKSIDEAAYVDGCTPASTIWYIILPLARPIITTVALMVFVSSWNEFLFANTFIQTESLRTVSTRFVRFTGEWNNDISKIYTAAAITIGPILIMYLFLQRTFIEGMTKGGVKG